jgi:amidase
MVQARFLDEYFRRHGKTVGPLHGVPITLKDQFNVKGYDSTLGYVGRAFKPAEEDAVLVEILKRLGAVVITKTNLPQSIMVSFSLSEAVSLIWNYIVVFGLGWGLMGLKL